MIPFIYPYKAGSKSAKALAEALGCRRIRLTNSRYRGRPSHMLINWGSSGQDIPASGITLNKAYAVGRAGNKLDAFRRIGMAGLSIPRITTDPEVAYQWDTNVMIRRTLHGHSGQGCVYVDRTERELLCAGRAPLYVEYIKKSAEYRFHVMAGKVIDVQQKRVRSGSEDNNFQIRSHANGWIFARTGIDVTPAAYKLATDAVTVLGLDFGAVDVIYNSHRNEYFVLEVNTAPGLVGETVTNYANAIRELL